MGSWLNQATAQRTQRIDALDGIRLFCFLGVYGFHSDPAFYWRFGYVLPFFFVLSGFLITQQLQWGVESNAPLKRVLYIFYTRRLLRILPAYTLFLVIFGLSFGGPFLFSQATFSFNLSLFHSTATNAGLTAILKIMSGDWWKTGLHFWSLSVEEQFYLLFPLPFLLFRNTFRLWGPLVLIATIVLRGWHEATHPLAFYGALPWVAGEYFLWGGLATLATLRGPLPSSIGSGIIYASLVLTGLLFALYPMKAVSSLMFFRPSYMQTFFGFTFALLILGIYSAPRNLVSRLLAFRPFVWLGLRTYGMYLSHLLAWSLSAWLCQNFPVLGSPGHLVRLSLILGMATASWYFVERPALRIKDRLPFGPTTPKRSNQSRHEWKEAA